MGMLTEAATASDDTRCQSSLFHEPLTGHNETRSNDTASAKAKPESLRQENLIILGAQTEHTQRENAKNTARDQNGCWSVRIGYTAKDWAKNPHQRELNGEYPGDRRRRVCLEKSLFVCCLEDANAMEAEIKLCLEISG